VKYPVHFVSSLKPASKESIVPPGAKGKEPDFASKLSSQPFSLFSPPTYLGPGLVKKLSG